MRLSYSAIETFKNCPQKYYFREVKKIRAPRSKEAAFGSSVHAALKFLHSSAPLYPTLEQLLDYFKKKWPKDIAWLSQEEKLYFEQGEKILTAYYTENDPQEFSVVDLESYFEVPIKGTDGKLHLLTGKIDRIDKQKDGSFEIIDYKTARRMPSQKKVNDDLQLSLYHLGIRHRWPQLQKPVRVTLYFLRHGEKLSTSRKDEDLENTRVELQETIHEIETSSFEPKPGPLCDWCSYKPICPAWSHLYRNKERPEPEEKELQAIIEEYITLSKETRKNEKRLSELKTALNAIMDKKQIERVFGEHEYIMRALQKRYGYDGEKLKSVLEPLGKWEEILTVDGKKLTSLTASLPEDIRNQIKKARTISKEFRALSIGKIK